jgi:hypothetical protein
MTRRIAPAMVGWLTAVATLCLTITHAAALTTVEHEITFDAARLSVREADGVHHVEVDGAMRTFEAGRPDLPWVGELVEIPAGMKVQRVEIVEASTAPLAARAQLPSAPKVEPGLNSVVRTAPDPAWFGRRGFQPESPVRLGAQGSQRGRNLVALQVCPVRWDASTGRLDRVSRVRLRLVLEPGTEPVLTRERIVPEWEDGPARGIAALGGARAGIAAARPANVQPLAQAPADFQATYMPSLLGSPVAYVIVTNDAMAAEFQRLADWKTQKGFPAVVRTMTAIRTEYPHGADDADRVRQFLRDAYQKWGAKWVLLGGDVEVVPTRYARTSFYGGENIPADMYFSCLDGNWNADGDSAYGEGWVNPDSTGDAADMMPEVWVGRAPVTNPTEAARFVDKTFQYEKTPVGDYENTVLYFAEVLFPQVWNPGDFVSLDGAQLAEETLPSLRSHPGIRYTRLYENHTDPRWEPGSFLETKETVIDSLNRGYNVAVHIGHGYRNVMAVGQDRNLDNGNAMGLTNGNRLFNLYSINCTSNAIDFPCIGEAFMLAPNGGSVTNVGSTRLDFPSAGRAYQKEFFRLVYVDSVSAVGEAQARQKLPFVGYSTTDNVNRWTQFTLLLLGDPELRIYTALPRTLSVTHPGSVLLSDSTLTVQVQTGGLPLADATVVAWKPGDEYRTGVTNAAGSVVLPFRPDSLGAITLTVTGYDARPYQAQIPVTFAIQPVLADRAPTIDDDASGGTAGNADGKIDAGETVDVRIQVKNQGAQSASGVTGTLSTTEPGITIPVAGVSYGSISPGATTNVSSSYRVVVPLTTPDDKELRFNLRLADSGGRTWNESITLRSHGHLLRHYSHTIVDAGGNGNGIADPGEAVQYLAALRNLGSGRTGTVTGKLRNYDGLATVTDSTASWGVVLAGQEKVADAFAFTVSSAAAQLELRVSDGATLVFTQKIDLVRPQPPLQLNGTGAATSITLNWTKSPEADLLGYHVERSDAAAGPFARLTAIPTERTSYYVDAGLQPLTRYYYRVAAVDSSGNTSAWTPVRLVSTNPPTHPFFPMTLPTAAQASVVLEHIWPGYPISIVSGSGVPAVGSGDVLHAWNPDGTAPIDADGSIATSGDFSLRGKTFLAPPSAGDLDGDGTVEIVASSWDSMLTFAFQRDGSVRPGWPVATTSQVWSAPALGDIDGDGTLEVFFGSNGLFIYGFRHDGTEIRDGDNNPSTYGVWRRADGGFNLGTPALADLDNDGKLDVVYGTSNAWIYAQRWNGTSVPGFSVYRGGSDGAHIFGSIAIGHLDGPGDTQLDLVVPIQRGNGNDSLIVYRANGTLRPGWPVEVEIGGGNIPPSPALADMNNDGFLDIVHTGTDGLIYAYDRNAVPILPLHGTRWSTITRTSLTMATEASPVIADINGDGMNDIVIGDELGYLTAISADGTVLPGFPILTGGELKGSAGLCDCDGDGLTEIVIAGMDEMVHMWDYDFPFSPNGPPPWPQFHHDARRTGSATSLPFVGVEPDPGPGPATVRALELAAPSPNPAPRETRVAWAVPATRLGATLDVSVFDLSGRRVRTLERGPAKAGRHGATWDLRDDDGRRVDSGVFFVRMRLGDEVRSHRVAVLR